MLIALLVIILVILGFTILIFNAVLTVANNQVKLQRNLKEIYDMVGEHGEKK